MHPAQLDRLMGAMPPALRRLAGRGIVRSYCKNTVLLTEGDSGDSLLVVLQGQLKVYATDENGREITFDTVAAGDFYGEMSLDGGTRPASAMTTQATVCVVVPRHALQAHLDEEPQFATALMLQVIRRARAATEKARQMALLDVYGRVVHALESEQGCATAQRPVELTRVTHQQIASRVGASREMVSRLLKDLERGGYLQLGVRRIVLRRKLPARW